MQLPAYGFVGAGEITAAIVDGLTTGVAGPPAIFLSPRGRSVARELAGTIASWLAEHGVDHDAATAYTTHVFGQLGQSLLQRTDSLATLTGKHMTPGGINQQLMTDLRRDGMPDAVRRALDRILDRLKNRKV